jgi:hypothetical protein
MRLANTEINNVIAEKVMKWQLTGNNEWRDGHGNARITEGEDTTGRKRLFSPSTSINDAMHAVKTLLRRHNHEEWKFWSAATHHTVGVIRYVCGLKKNGTGIAVASHDSYSIAICDALLQVVNVRMRGHSYVK